MMVYFDRLPALDDNFLVAVGLIRQNLQANLASLDSKDLHR
jgi:hypothetical protein